MSKIKIIYLYGTKERTIYCYNSPCRYVEGRYLDVFLGKGLMTIADDRLKYLEVDGEIVVDRIDESKEENIKSYD